MSVLFGLLGVLLDLLVQMFTLMAAGSLVAVVVRGEAIDEWGVLVVFVGLAVGGLVVLVRRIWGLRRTIRTARAGSAEVSTVSWSHFVVDGLWIAAAVLMIRGARAPVWDDGTRAAAITVLALGVGLCALRVIARVRASR